MSPINQSKSLGGLEWRGGVTLSGNVSLGRQRSPKERARSPNELPDSYSRSNTIPGLT